MNFGFVAMSFVLGLSFSANAMVAGDFGGAKPEPIGRVKESPKQLRVLFPEEMVKQANTEVMNVTCSPAVKGFSGWADNNTVWTYDFKTDSEYTEPKLDGGTKCHITQAVDMKSSAGTTWKAGTIDYTVIVGGPNVTNAEPPQSLGGALRETEPVILITFDGPVNRELFFQEQSGYLNYMSSNAPSEKLALASVPVDQQEKIFEVMQGDAYYGPKFSDRNWVLATIKQNLIPGSKVKLTIEKQASADNADVRSEEKFSKELDVRSQFKAEIQCAEPSAKSGICMPASAISIQLNGLVKWADIKDAYIEYIPFKSTDKKTVRSYAEISPEHKIGFWDNIINMLAQYFPYLAKYSDTVLNSVIFNVNIEPQTTAKVVLPQGLADLEGRVLSNVLTEFHVRIGAMGETIRVPQLLSFFEKKVPAIFLPVAIVNQNQKISIRKTGTDAKAWAPVRDFPTMIKVIRAYADRGEYREEPQYTSPLDQIQQPSTLIEQKLTGDKNRQTVLQFPFKQENGELASGLYPFEISSATYEKAQSQKDYFLNPKAVLPQVTDLTVHLKRGSTATVAWVTHLSDATPVANATIEVYNCLGEVKATVQADASGLATIPNQKWAADCQAGEHQYSPYFTAENFYVGAKAGDDLALIHSSWTSSASYAMGAPGIEWFSSDINEEQPYFHAILGVNLVKPGQQVPIELIAKVPQAKGFREVPAAQLPTTARIVSYDDEDKFYEFPLTWANGKAQITWQVPNDSSVRLGGYSIVLKTGDRQQQLSNDIEVAEFKVPLMSGLIAFPNEQMVRPDVIPVSSIVRYANGVGAKGLPVDLSYYFSPTSMSNKDLPNFTFGTGALSFENEAGESGLPDSMRPSVIAGLTTSEDGSIQRDLAKEQVNGGKSVAELLKSVGRPQHLVVRVRYQDQMGEFQTLSQAKDIYNSSVYVGTSLVTGARAQARLQVAVVDVNQRNITSLQDLELKVTRIETRVIGEELFGGLIKNTLERELKSVRWPQSCSLENKVVSCAVGALKEGSYAFEVASKSSQQKAHQLFKVDTEGRVFGPNDYYNFGDDEGDHQLPLALNKATYKDGERAVVSYAAPFKSCQALVSLERNDVIQAYVVPNACAQGHVEVPVDAAYAPNAFVSVYAITGRAESSQASLGELDLGRPTYRLGFANLKVNWDRYKSNVTVKTNKEKYEPGETVEVAVAVAPTEGALQNSTVTLVAIEEKILELKKNPTYAILEALMQMRGHSVETVTALENVQTVTQENQDKAASPVGGGRKGGDEGGDGSSKSEFKRKLFNALVTFQPNVPVENGVAKFSFKTNDSLTRFKVFAIATDSNQKFGHGEAVYLTEQETQAYSNIPSVAHTGDAYPLKVTVQNNSRAAGKYRAEITATIKDRGGNVIGTKKFSKEATIDKAGSQAIDVGQLEVGDDAGSIEYAVRVYDQNNKLVDSMEPEPQVILPSVPLAVTDVLLSQTENGALTKALVKDASALAAKGEIRVIASRSLVASALTQIAQRMDQAAFADFFIESRFDRALLRGSEARPEEMKALLESLIGYMDGEGFVKYYPQARRGSVYLTASILSSLQQEPWALKLMPPALAEKMKNAVSLVLTKTVNKAYIGETPMDWVRAQMVMARAAFAFNDETLLSAARAVNTKITEELKRNPNVYGEPVEKWATNDLVERWLLEVYAAPSTAAASEFLTQLTSPARLIRTGNMAQLKGAPTWYSFYTDETIETAKLELGLSLIKGDKNLAKSVALGLVNLNLKGWYNVSTMAGVGQGLKAFGRSYETETVSGSTLIAVPEQQASATVDLGQKLTGGLTTEWTKSTATVKVTHGGAGQPWVSVQALAAVPLTAARGQGLSIEKVVRNVTRESGYQAGDIIEVTLNINANAPLRHVAVSDPIPAGSNIIGDAYGSVDSGQKSYSGYKLYFERLGNGMNTVKYQYQLNNPGSFKLPPTRAEGLYEPSMFAEAPNATMKVQ